MRVEECRRECEVVEAVGCGRWPERCPVELRDHVGSCAVCSQVLEVALALHDDREAACSQAEIPSAGLVWWRAELRARQEAMRAASRPITFAQAFGGAAAIGVALALLNRVWPWLKQLFALTDFSTFSVVQWGVVIGFALAVLVIGPLAMYLVLSDD
jgi:hypothetical protein